MCAKMASGTGTATGMETRTDPFLGIKWTLVPFQQVYQELLILTALGPVSQTKCTSQICFT